MQLGFGSPEPPDGTAEWIPDRRFAASGMTARGHQQPAPVPSRRSRPGAALCFRGRRSNHTNTFHRKERS